MKNTHTPHRKKIAIESCDFRNSNSIILLCLQWFNDSSRKYFSQNISWFHFSWFVLMLLTTASINFGQTRFKNPFSRTERSIAFSCFFFLFIFIFILLLLLLLLLLPFPASVVYIFDAYFHLHISHYLLLQEKSTRTLFFFIYLISLFYNDYYGYAVFRIDEYTIEQPTSEKRWQKKKNEREEEEEEEVICVYCINKIHITLKPREYVLYDVYGFYFS